MANPGRRVTHRLAWYVWQACQSWLPRTSLTIWTRIQKTVKAVEKHVLQRELGRTDHDDLPSLAIDGMAVDKGHSYMTVVLDCGTG